MSNKKPQASSIIGLQGSGSAAFQEYQLTKFDNGSGPNLINRTIYNNSGNSRGNTNDSMTGVMLQNRMSRNQNQNLDDGATATLLSEISNARSFHKNSTPSQFWYNPDQNQYYLIDWRGNKSHCDNGGQQKAPKQNPTQGLGSLTTYGSFNKAQLIQKQKVFDEQNFSPDKSNQLSKNIYLPTLNKFDGYVQFRCPVIVNNSISASTLLPDLGAQVDTQQDVDNISHVGSTPVKSQINQKPPKIHKSIVLKSSMKKQQEKSPPQSAFQILLDDQSSPNAISLIHQKKQQDQRHKSVASKAQLLHHFEVKEHNYDQVKTQILRSPKYFHKQRVSQEIQQNQSNLINAYANFLRKSQEKHTHSNSVENKREPLQQPYQNIQNDEKIPLQSFEVMQEAFIKKQVRAFKLRKNGFSKNNDQTRQVLEASIKLIEHRERDRQLREPPEEVKSLRPSASFSNQLNVSESQQQQLVKQHAINNQSQSTLFQKNRQESQRSIDKTALENPGSGRYHEMDPLHYRLLTYSDIKAQKNAQKTIQNFKNLKIGHETKINRLLSKSPIQEFIDENYLEMLKNPSQGTSETIFLPAQQDGEFPKTSSNVKIGKYTGFRVSGEKLASSSPDRNNAGSFNVKCPRDFKSPFQEQEELSRSSNVIDANNKNTIFQTSSSTYQSSDNSPLKNNRSVLKQRTKGMFTESVDLPDPGVRFRQEKASLLSANPELLKLLHRKEIIEHKKLKEKKDEKILQEHELLTYMHHLDKKAYKTFVKNPTFN